MEENEYIFSDGDLLDLSESAPLTEGGPLDDFLAEARVVAEAIEKTGADLSGLWPQARALFFMRGFYLLGILRGGEAYRATLLDDIPGAVERPAVPFELSEVCADLFAKELEGQPTETVRAIYQALGLTANRAERRSGWR